MGIEKLQKQKAAIEAQIKQAEQVEKHRVRVERMVIKLINKHPILFTSDATVVEAKLGEAIAAVAAGL